MRAVTAHGRSGLATAAVLAVPGARLLSHPGADAQHVTPANSATRTISLAQPITSLDVQSQDGSVRVQAGSGPGVHIIELISYDKSVSPPPQVADSVSGGRLTLADPECATSGCAVSFVVTVPAMVPVTVASNGAPVAVSGVAGANVESGGAPVTVSRLTGLLTVGTDGGSLDLNGLTGALQADSAGGPVVVRDLGSQTAGISTGGGSGQVAFAVAPELVTLSTDGGPSASRSLTVTSGGGPLTVSPAGTGQ